jgi:hypothetical protein
MSLRRRGLRPYVELPPTRFWDKPDINMERSDGVSGLDSLSATSRTAIAIPKEEYSIVKVSQ